MNSRTRIVVSVFVGVEVTSVEQYQLATDTLASIPVGIAGAFGFGMMWSTFLLKRLQHRL